MAQQMKPSNDDDTSIANTEARRKRQMDGFAKVYDLEQRIAELKAEHIKPLQDELTKERRSIKADCDIDNEDLKLNYGFYKRTREAEAMDDEADRERILGNLRDSFAAMAQGGQLNWLDAALTEAGYSKAA